MKRSMGSALASLAVAAAMAGIPAAAAAWAAGTHAYVAKHTNKMGGLVSGAETCRRVLGSNGPDLFNSIWSDEAQALAAVLHRRDPAPNVAPWYAATTPLDRAFGFGFASHNDAWGTDATAHHAGRTFGEAEGYVIAKAEILGGLLAETIGAALGLPPDAALALATDVSHNFVEFAVDFLLAEADPQLGWTLYASAGCYAGPADDDLLLLALGPYLAPVLSDDPGTGEAIAEAWIDTVMPQFVAGLGANGWVLTLPYDVGKPLIAHLLATEAQEYLAWKYAGVPGFDPPPPLELLEALASVGLDAARALCAPDFMAEIEATIGYVNGRMSAEGIFPAAPR